MATNIDTLRKRLARVNTQLNLIEEGWPWRPPTTRSSTVNIDTSGCRLPKYAVEELRANGGRLKAAFPKGWEFTVRGFSWGGRDAGCIMEIFVNGGSFASVRYMVGDAAHLKTTAQCITECTNLFWKLTSQAIARLEKYPLKTVKSKKYKALCTLRRRLNGEWQRMMDAVTSPDKYNVPGKYAYPYGEHKPGWPVFEGMQLGK